MLRLPPLVLSLALLGPLAAPAMQEVPAGAAADPAALAPPLPDTASGSTRWRC